MSKWSLTRASRAASWGVSASFAGLFALAAGASEARADANMSRVPVSHQLVRSSMSPMPKVASNAAGPVAGQDLYYGGHVMSHIDVVTVYWGAKAKTNAPSDAEGFYTALVDSPYIDWMGEYDTAGAK